MLKNLFETIREKYESISLSVSEYNPALKLYKSLGFYEYQTENHAIIMKKDL